MSSQTRRASRLARACAATLCTAVVSIGLPLLSSEWQPSSADTPFTINGLVYRDDNGDGVKNLFAGDPPQPEPGLPGIEVKITPDSGEIVSATTRADGTFAANIASSNSYSSYRIEVLDPTNLYTDSVAGPFNATTVQFLRRGGSAVTVVQALDVGVVDRRFYTNADVSCFDSLLTSSTGTRDYVHSFGPPDNASGLGTPLKPSVAVPDTPWQTDTFGTGSLPLENALGLTTGPDGDIWVTSETDAIVRRYSSAGVLKTIYFTNELKAPSGIRFGPDGLLYVADNSHYSLPGTAGGHNRIWRLDPEKHASIFDTTGWEQFTSFETFNYNEIHPKPYLGMAFRNDGFMYVVADALGLQNANSRVLQLHGPGHEAAGTRTGMEWILPHRTKGLEIGPDNIIYVAASTNTAGGIYRIDPAVPDTSTLVINMAAASHASFGPDGDMYVVNGHGNGGSNTRRGMVIRYNGPLKPQPFAEAAHPIYISNSVVNGAPDGYTQVAPRMLVWKLKDTACASLQVPIDLGNRVWSDEDDDGIQDPGEPGISSVTVTAFKPGGIQVGTTTTDANGNWHIPITGDQIVHTGSYEIRFSGPILESASATPTGLGANALLDSNVVTDSAPSPDVHKITFTMDKIGMSPEMHSLDAGFNLPPLGIGGNLFSDSDNNGLLEADGPLDGWPVEVWDSTGTTKYASVLSDAAGFYEVQGLSAGDYIIRIPNSHTEGKYLSSSGNPATPLSGIYEPAADPDNNTDNVDDGTHFSDPAYTQTLPITLTGGEEPTTDGDDANSNLTADFGFVLQSGVGNRIWCDDDDDGLFDYGEPAPQEIITAQLLNTSNAVVATTSSNDDGSYIFDSVTPATYRLQFVIPTGYGVTTQNVSSNAYDTADSDPDSTGLTGTFDITQEIPTNLTIDLGLQCASVGNLVFNDADDDGTKDDGEVGIAGIDVALLNGDAVVDSATTDVNGAYGFYGLAAGDYTVQIPSHELYDGTATGFVSSVGYPAQGSGTIFEPAPDPDPLDIDTDNDDSGSTDWTTTTTASLAVSVEIGEANASIDFGLYNPALVGPSTRFVTTFAGSGATGNTNPGADASPTSVAISSPFGVAVGSDATVYISNGSYISEVKNGYIKRLATIGGAYNFGNTSLAIFGNYLYVTVSSSIFNVCKINRVDLSLTTYPRSLDLWSGTSTCTESGADGPVGSASWVGIGGIAFDSAGNAFVTETTSGKVRKITPEGNVSTIISGLGTLSDIAIDPSSDYDLYVAETSNDKRVLKYDLSQSPITTPTTLHTDATTYGAGFGLAVHYGAAYHSRYFFADIRRFALDTTSYAGTYNSRAFSGDGGPATAAKFSYLGHIAFGPDGTLYIADAGNNRVRKVYVP